MGLREQEKTFEEIIRDITKRLETNEFTEEEKWWILNCYIPQLHSLKAKNGLEVQVSINLESMKTWYRKGKVGEVVWG